MNRETRAAVVGLLFVLSGGLGLVYQVAWFKYLALFLGNTTYAQTIVLATFMGGLAIGAAVWGRRADRVPRPLALYGWLEVGIAAYCLLYPSILSILREFFVSTVRSAGWPSDSTAVLLFKLLISLLSLLPPTILMGGTLPVLVRFLTRSLRDAGTNVATLYFLNSFGAVVGALLAGFFMVRLIGLQATVLSAAVINLAIGLVALVLGRRTAQDVPEFEVARDSDNGGTIYDRRQTVLAILIAGISGFCAMVYEVAWVRMLIPVLGSSTYSFSLMLVAFISGIAIGSALVTRFIARVRDLMPWLAGTQAGVATAMLLILPLYSLIPYLFWWTAHLLARSESSYPLFLVLQFAFGFVLMLVPTVFMGMGLPVATRIAAQSVERIGRTVGTVFSVNTMGTVAGALTAGLVLFPLVGLRRTMEIGILLNAASALAVLLLEGKGYKFRWRLAAAGGGVAFVVLLVLLPPWSQATLLTGVFRFINKNVEPPDSYASFVQQYESMKILSYDEGTTATVGVIEASTPEGPQQVLIINGKADASSRTDLPTQVLLGELPMLMHPSPSQALVIGYGSGVTAGSILRHPVERVDCVEISPEVVRAADHFAEASGMPLADPRFHLQVEDALAYLQLTNRTYDVIVSEPSNPWIAGIGSLYTHEFFDLCRRRLNKGGLMVQWFHLYEMDDEMFQLVLRTFQASFPSVTLWSPMSTDVILIGAEHPVKPNDERLVRLMGQPQVRDDLRRIAVEDPGTLLTLQVLSGQNVRTYAGAGPFNTEDLPTLEYGAPRAFFVNRGVKGLEAIDERIHHSESITPLQGRWLERPFSDEELLNAARWHARPVRGNPLLAYQFSVELSRRHPNDPGIVKMLADIAAQVGRTDESLLLLRKRAALLPRDPIALENYAWKIFEAGNRTANAIVPQRTDDSEQLLHRAIALVQDTVDLYRVRLADIMYAGKRYRQAMDQYARAIQIREKHRPDPYIAHDVLLTRLALCLYQVGEKPRAVGYALRATQINPGNEQARDLVFRIWTEGSSPEPQR